MAMTPAEIDRFRPHLVEWTRGKSARFWDVMAPRLIRSGLYFTEQVGGALLDFLQRGGVPLKGDLLDFGCGPGFLLKELFDRRIPAWGADFSSESIGGLHERFGASPYFKGATLIKELPTNYPAGRFDLVFLIETIEHLLDEDLDATITELERIIKPKGLIVVSTPNAENRSLNETMCPDCGCIFHKMQHVRSWTAASLDSYMADHGFVSVRSEPVHFSNTLLRTRILTRVRRGKLPHLLYVGRKRSVST
jgi:2-polyprenyl-3-methyl-5-hydroxy-6-metoxy-1,4-benzoquinol methylase